LREEEGVEDDPGRERDEGGRYPGGLDAGEELEAGRHEGGINELGTEPAEVVEGLGAGEEAGDGAVVVGLAEAGPDEVGDLGPLL
jgi:hypothetical protein